MRFTLFLALFLMSSAVVGQQFCGFDALHHIHHSMENDANERILQRILSGQTRTDEVLTVPVVVHIIHNNGEENIPDEAVLAAMEYLNEAFSNTGNFLDGLGVNTGIEFCLAATDPNGNFTTGINRVVSGLTDVSVPSQEAELKALSFWDSELYLNIWVVSAITREEGNPGVVGFATFPTAHGNPMDGIVVEAYTFGSNPANTTVTVHECGHYLGLYHTFQDGCPNDDCLTSGDRICDTPPDASVFNTFCFDGTNSCDTDEDDISINNPFRPASSGGLGDQLDMQTNFMDYSNLACFEIFTEGQKDRMRASLLELRASLLDGNQCDGPCDLPIEVLVTHSNLEVEVGEGVAFTNLSSNFTGAEWFVDGVPQGGGVLFDFVPEEQGTYTVEIELVGAQPGCAESASFEVQVTCPVVASFLYSETTLPEGGTLTLENTSTGATAYTWYVDGEAVSNATDLAFTFDELGGHSVYLEAVGSTCTDISAPLFVSVGTCNSGNEANVWLTFNASGSAYGLDFNSDPPEEIPVNSIPNSAGHCKTTLCDANGNVQYVSLGQLVLNRDFQVMPNGNDLLGHPSSHYGSMIVKRPGSDTEHYLFTGAAEETGSTFGLRYSIIDGTLDNGYGDVTEKNLLIDNTDQEAITCIRHCNLIHFWLVTYDQAESVYKAWLVTEAGIAQDPVVTPLSQEVNRALPITPNPKGDQIMHGAYLMAFDAAEGTLELEAEFEAESIYGWEFSANGRYLYLITGVTTSVITQIDLWNLDPTDPWATGFALDLPPVTAYFYPQRAPDGHIYVEDVFTNDIARITDPNLPGELLTFETEYGSFSALLNSFGNYYHAYISGQSLFVEGPDQACSGQTVEYGIYGADCILDVIEWTVEGAGFTPLENGKIDVHFANSGTVTITALLAAECGEVSDTFAVEVGPNAGLELGEDFGTCAGNDSFTLDAGAGFTTYTWNTGETTQSITVNTPGSYSVTVDNGFCLATDSVAYLDGESPAIDLGPDFELCDSEIVILDAGSGFNDYVWQDGTTGPTYTVYEGGTYTVTATVPCAASDAVTVDDCGQVISSIQEQESAGTIAVYPNPNSGQFVVEAPSGEAGTWRLTNAAGQLVAEGTLERNGKTHIALSVSTGSYVLHMHWPERSYRQRLIIQ